TTVMAAATARRAAASGARTLVLCTDAGHALADVLEARVGDEPAPAGDGLWAQAIDLTAPPGVDGLLALQRLHGHAGSGEFDVVIVDCPATGETRRLLALPDVGRSWLDRIA